MEQGSVKPNKARERAAGVTGTVLSIPWIFNGTIQVIDAISRGQMVMELNPYISFVTKPWAFLLELFGSICLLYYATRLEQVREIDETPRIIRPYSVPQKPKRHRLWIKLWVASVIFVAGGTVATVRIYHRHHVNNSATIKPEKASNSPSNSVHVPSVIAPAPHVSRPKPPKPNTDVGTPDVSNHTYTIPLIRNTATPNLTLGHIQRIVLSEDVTVLPPITPPIPQDSNIEWFLFVEQDAVGQHACRIPFLKSTTLKDGPHTIYNYHLFTDDRGHTTLIGIPGREAPGL